MCTNLNAITFLSFYVNSCLVLPSDSNSDRRQRGNSDSHTMTPELQTLKGNRLPDTRPIDSTFLLH